MKLLRNREIRILMVWHSLLTVGLMLVGMLTEIPAVWLILMGGAAYGVLHLAYTHRRYRIIEELSASIERILHGQEKTLISESAEGELSILHSEIQKMLGRLQEAAEALRADKVHLVDAIADISHQLRTPLTSMNLTVSLLSAEQLSEEKRLSLTRELRKSLRRIDWLIEALLKLSRLDAGTVAFKEESVSVRALIEKATEPMAVAMELKDITFVCRAAQESFVGDAAWCAEALGNIVKNCVEHSEIGGSIEIIAGETPLYTEIVVRDSGKGFDEADIPHLFERFYKGKGASDESIGIGLALARSIIVRQNGTIQASNLREGGAQFVIRFYKGVI